MFCLRCPAPRSIRTSRSGFTRNNQIDPIINLIYSPTPETTLHGGFARYMQVPSFQGISPTAPAAFAGTTAAGPPGASTPFTEDDFEWDVGVVHHLNSKITLSQDDFVEITRHYLDTGEFGVVPIFAPFNYNHGSIWGSETAINYKDEKFSAYGNVTIGRNLQRGALPANSISLPTNSPLSTGRISCSIISLC
jgi:outer membrane receptor protein involved in Fe transport